MLKKIQRQSPNKLTREDEKILEIGNNVKNTVSNSFDKAKNFVEKKTLEQKLIGYTWTLDSEDQNLILIFKNGGKLLITRDGIVKNAVFEIIVDSNSMIITEDAQSKMFNLQNVGSDLLQLTDMSTAKQMNFYNQTKITAQIKKELRNDKKILSELEYKKRTDVEFAFFEKVNNITLEQVENDIELKREILQTKNGIFDVVNEIKNESKSPYEIILEFKKWQKGDNTRSLFEYINSINQ